MAKINVMIVDDAALMRTVIRNVVQGEADMNVVASCENGKVALDQLRQAAPHVIILDIEMPQMDGLTFLRHAKLQSRARVIVLSSVVDVGSEKALAAKKLGADAVLAKPSGAVSFDLAEKRGTTLVAAIRALGRQVA